ncbi:MULTISPECIES: hypothetical protein [Nostoc]|uniref:Uncharacterized protein n=2 Tax=Nostoc TaxID=1177 RepID=A0ABR8IC14_9NOSO|nr:MULTISPECIES: hypothetical protein [Nostoc]MBD2562719.1 hypothetical protein [Nostoc linckia FACHB-391]MBD2648341.1 hypothetical protein [Nostoc foliaceum FACHB-393]
MVRLANITFHNSTSGNANISYKLAGQFAGNVITVTPNTSSPAISGTLLTIDIDTLDSRYNPVTKSYDFTQYLPNGLWVEHESPYTLKIVIGNDSTTLLLRITDKDDTKVVEKAPFVNKGFAVSMTKQELFNQLKAGISNQQSSGYSINTLKEILSDLQPVNYKWLTYNFADGQFWNAEIKGNSWGSYLDTIELGIAYPTIVEKLSQAIQAAEGANLLVNPYTPQAVEGLILRVSEAIAAAAKIPYMLKDLTLTSGASSPTKDFSNGDITINLSNKDAGDQYILVFQKPTNLNEMYDTLFPTAWKIVPLGNAGSDSITYPVSLQIQVKESAEVYDSKQRGTIKSTPVGQLWQFYTQGNFQRLEQVSGQTVDGLVGCVNNASQKIDIGLAKDGTSLVIKRGVSKGDQANFKLTPKLYFAYATDLQEGDLIKSDVSASKLYELDLTNLKSIDIELSLKDSTSGEKQWKATNRVVAS